MTARYCLAFGLFLGLCVLTPRDALADSDGYYCTTDRYIAYEFSFSKRLSSAHVLTVVFFDDAEGRIEAIDVPLDVFQVHGMKCDDDAVELLSYAALYRIELSNRRNAAALKIREFVGNAYDNAGLNNNKVAKSGDIDGIVAGRRGRYVCGYDLDGHEILPSRILGDMHLMKGR